MTIEELLAGVNGTNNASFITNNGIDLSKTGGWGDTNPSIAGLNTDPSSGSWMDSLGGYDGIKGMLGAGQLGLGFLGYLDNKKTADKQRQLLGQQIDTNQFLLGQAKGRQNDIARDFGGRSAPQGLAANQVNKVL